MGKAVELGPAENRVHAGGISKDCILPYVEGGGGEKVPCVLALIEKDSVRQVRPRLSEKNGWGRSQHGRSQFSHVRKVGQGRTST